MIFKFKELNLDMLLDFLMKYAGKDVVDEVIEMARRQSW